MKNKKRYNYLIKKENIDKKEIPLKNIMNEEKKEIINLIKKNDHSVHNKSIYQKIGFLNWFIFFSYIAGMMQGLIIVGYNKIPVVKPNYFILTIIIYYVVVICQNKSLSLESIKYTFFNFIGIITLYNIALIYNPLNMIEVSSEYFISNILYFYLSFLIITFDYKFYDKIIFIIDIIFGIIENSKKEIVKPFIIVTFNITLISVMISFLTMLYKFNINLIIKIMYTGGFTIATIYVVIWVNYMLSKIIIKNKNGHYKVSEVSNNNQRQYVKLRNIIGKFENIINIIIDWLLELFKVQKINSFNLIKEDGYLNRMNTFVTISTKIAPLILLSILMSVNAYYPLNYAIDNEKYCLNEDIASDSKIIKLKNGNVLVFNGFELNEKDCQKEKINLKIMLQ